MGKRPQGDKVGKEKSVTQIRVELYQKALSEIEKSQHIEKSYSK